MGPKTLFKLLGPYMISHYFLMAGTAGKSLLAGLAGHVCHFCLRKTSAWQSLVAHG